LRLSRKLLSVGAAVALIAGFSTPVYASSAALVPTFGASESVAGGFAVKITNWDSSFTWSATASDCALASVANGWLTVTGVLANQAVQARVFTAKIGHDDGMATVSGSAGDFSPRSQLDSEAGSHSYSSHAVGPDGAIYVAWAKASTVAYLSKSTDGGQTWALVKSWPLLTPAAQISVGVAVHTDGKLAMVWQEGPNNSYKIMVSTSADGGTTWRTPEVLNENQNTQLVSVQFSSAGDVIVVWNVHNGTRWVSPYRVSTDLGATWSDTENSSNLTDASFRPSLVKLSDGRVSIIWDDNSAVRAAMFDNATKTFGTSAALSRTAMDSSQINASTDLAGNLALTWTEGAAGQKNVMFATYNGAAWSNPETVSSAPGTHERPMIAKTATAVTVAWRSAGNEARVRSTSSLDPITWRAEVVVSPAATDVYQVKVASFGAGKLAATWLRRGDNFYYLEVSVSADDGSTWSAPNRVSAPNDDNYQPILMPNNLGALAILWRIQKSTLSSLKITVLSPTTPADPREIYQVAEINPGVAHANIYDMAILNNKMYFIAKNDETGYELFEYDGTQVRLVQDLLPGPGNGLYDTQFVAKTATAVYFQGTDGITGYELYKFDGTAISLAAEINPATTEPTNATGQVFQGSMPGADGAAGVLGNLLFFAASHPSWGSGYVLDLANSSAQAEPLSSYFSGFTASGMGSPVVIGSTLYFIAGDAVYATTGTRGSTPVQVLGTDGKAPFQLGVLGSQLLISGSTTGQFSNIELLMWDSSTPSVAAALAADINPHTGSGNTGSFPVGFVTRCGESYFAASSGFDDFTLNRELWKWDGFEATLAKDFWPGGSGWPQSLYVAGDELFSFAQDADSGYELWKTAGSQTSMVADFTPGPTGSIGGAPPMLSWNNQLYTALRGPTGVELYAYGIKPPGHSVANFSLAAEPDGGDSGANGLPGGDTAAAAPAAVPAISMPVGGVVGAAGEDLEISGSNLATVTKAEIATVEAEIKEQSETRLKLAVPELAPGLYDLTLTSPTAQITLPDAVRIVAGPSDSGSNAGGFNAWTKMNQAGTAVTIYAKNVTGVGKVQFFLNGREIAWSRVRTAADYDGRTPRLVGNTSYVVRTIAVNPGRNEFRVRIDGRLFTFSNGRTNVVYSRR